MSIFQLCAKFLISYVDLSKFCRPALSCIIPEHRIVNKKEISNTMNNIFCIIREKLASKIDTAPNPLLSGRYTCRDSNVKFQFKNILVKEVRDEIPKIKTTKGFGNDKISCYFLKLELYLLLRSHWQIYSTHQLKQASFHIRGN